ncbi:MAG: Asp-tRNA(Asn)/Glu-tRNA(Gln) amidotransferase subunit GatC [Acutalibacteraceae bacterium]
MITREDIENIALLSKLYVPEEELDALTQEMQNIISFADTINNAAEDGTEFDNINNLSNAFREDEVVPSYSNEDILRNAPDSAQDHFLVKKRS